MAWRWCAICCGGWRLRLNRGWHGIHLLIKAGHGVCDELVLAWLVGGCIGVCLIIGLLCAHVESFGQFGFVVGWSVGVVSRLARHNVVMYIWNT